MTKVRDSLYYERLMEVRAIALRQAMTAGKTVSEQMDMEDELEELTFMPRLLAEVARGLPEARACVEALERAGNTPVDLVWMRVYPGYEYGEMDRVKYTRSEIIARLEKISFLDFGDEPNEWRDWLAAFEAEPPLLGYR